MIFQTLGLILIGFCLGLVDRMVVSVFRRIVRGRQYRRQREQLAAGVPLWEILKDKRYKA